MLHAFKGLCPSHWEDRKRWSEWDFAYILYGFRQGYHNLFRYFAKFLMPYRANFNLRTGGSASCSSPGGEAGGAERNLSVSFDYKEENE